MSCRHRLLISLCAIALVCFSTVSSAQTSWRQTSADDYTRYELLEPETQSFRIIYDVSATTGGATYYFNGIRRGSEPTVHGVTDLMTGEALDWELVDGSEARAIGMTNARAGQMYIKVSLPRPVPEHGEIRLRIDKTYRDTASYQAENGHIAFSRSLGIKRNSIVLPAGYELTRANYPSQIATEDDGRIKVSFMNRGPAGVPFVIEGRLLPQRAQASVAVTLGSGTATVQAPTAPGAPTPIGARIDYEFSERAFQDREIVYFLQQPETHAFRLYHDYTETRPGVDRYVNVVRAGSKASNPSARVLDTGEVLEVETLRGNAITERGVDTGRDPTPETEVVVIWFEPVKQGHSTRLRIEETYTDPNRYLLVGDELVWDRAFGRPRNTVILPDGWYVTASSIPATVRETDDGRIQLDYMNDRPDRIEVFVKGKRR